MCIRMSMALLLLAMPFLAEGEVYVKSEGSTVRIGNDLLEREISAGDRLRTTRLVNKLTGHVLEMKSQDFLIRLNDGRPDAVTLTADDFAVLDRKQTDTPHGGPSTTLRAAPSLSQGGKQITFSLKAEKPDVAVEVTYEITRPDDFYTRKQIVVRAGDRLVNWVEVESFDVPDAVELRYGQKDFDVLAEGRPIYIGNDVFAGLEYPAGYNVPTGRTVHLRHYPGRAGVISSRRALLGVCADKPCRRITDAILDYITRERVRPVKHVTGWFDYFNQNRSDAECEKHVADATSLCGPDKVKLDFVHVDGGWANPKSIMREHPAFPGRLALIKKLAKEKLDCGLAVHICTAGGRWTVDADWVAAHYDAATDRRDERGRRKCFYCLADPRAHNDLKESLLYLLRTYDIEAFKFDWQQVVCGKAGHRGHLEGVQYGREAIIDSYLDILEALRREKPDVLLYNWVWPSPFWPLWYDAVFTGGIGGEINTSLVGPPAFSVSSLMCTAKDEHLLRRFYRDAPYFPTTDFMTSEPFRLGWGSWTTIYAHEDTLESIDWVLTAYMRGAQLTELYMSQFGSEETQKAHIEASKWRRANDPLILGKTRFFGGSPLAEEPYGYAHFDRENNALLLVRNPSVLPKSIHILFDETIGMWPDVGGGPEPAVSVQTIFPYLSCLSQKTAYGESLTLPLHPYETIVMEVHPNTGRGALPARSSGDAPKAAPKVEATPLRIEKEASGIRCSFQAKVPERCKADLIVLVRRPGLDAKVRINGRPADVEAPHKKLRDWGHPAQALSWSMFRAPLEKGDNKVAFELPQPEDKWADLPFAVGAPSADIMHCLLDVAAERPDEEAAVGSAAPQLPVQWRQIQRDTVVLYGGTEEDSGLSLPCEIYAVQRDAKLYTDRDYRVVSIPEEFIGMKSVRFPHEEAKEVSTIRLYPKEPVRVFVTFGEGAPWLAPQPGWQVYKKDAFKATIARCTPDIYYRDFPAGKAVLFPDQKGNFAVLGIKAIRP